MGLDLRVIGFEVVANDLTEPEIFGGRFYVRPIGKWLALGLSGIVDLDPSGELPDPDGDPATGPIFINGAFDLDIPIIERDMMSIVLFGDVGAMIPATFGRSAVMDGATELIPVDTFYYQAVYDNSESFSLDNLRNYGFEAGVFGNILILDYRFSYRLFNGTFRPAFFGPTYDRLRGGYVESLVDDLTETEAVPSVVGIFGEFGFDIGEKFYLEGSYLWPFIPSEGFGIGDASSNDEMHVEAILAEGLIPVVGLYGSFAYDRTDFIRALVDKDRRSELLFDANTVLSAEVIYPIAESLDVAVLVTTNQARDELTGEVLLKDNGKPQVALSIGIETRVHF